MGQHKSTRNRCNTCKIRKVKCDETRPACLQCLKQLHVCTYSSKEPGYKSSVEKTFDLEPSKMSAHSDAYYPNISELIVPSVGAPPLLSCNAIIRFTLRTAPSLVSQLTLDMYQPRVLQLAEGRPYLVHAILTVTFTHDWIIHATDRPETVTIQAYHMQKCARTLHDRLCKPFTWVDRNALWTSAVLLMCASVANTFSTGSALDDLDWIHVCRRTTKLALSWDVLRQGGSPVCWTKPEAMSCLPDTSITRFVDTTLQALDDAIELTVTDATDKIVSPTVQRDLVKGLQALLRMECCLDTVQNFLVWFTQWPESLIGKIQNLDPSALLVLALWCAKTCDFRWWISRRAMIVLREICDHFEGIDVPSPSHATLLDFCRSTLEHKRQTHTS